MSEKNRTQKLFCKCGCGEELIRDDSWRRYSRNTYITGHNVPITNVVSLLDKTKDNRKGQTGFLATKVISNIRHDAKKADFYLWVNRIYKNCLEKGVFDNLEVKNG